MKKKWTLHIIAATALVVFIVLGLACVTMSKEEMEAREAQRVAEGKGGNIVVKLTTNEWYFFLDPYSERDQMFIYGFASPLMRNGVGQEYTVLEDGEYTIRYRKAEMESGWRFDDFNQAQKEAKENGGRYWSSKTIYVSGYQTFTVEIP